MGQHYLCAACKKDFPSSMVEVDHIVPVVSPKKGFENWDVYIQRLFSEKTNFQILCRPCHLEKTQKDI